MLTRPIPSSGEALPVIGCGTYLGFDVAEPDGADARLQGVLGALFESGGAVLDSSPMYGRAEGTLGRLLAAAGTRPRAFVATKVWTSGRERGIAQMQASFELLRTDVIDLMQVHNLVDWQTHWPTLQAWQQQGRVRYLGVTHYTARAHAELEAVLAAHAMDFVQINYSAADRAATRRILPLAAERGIAVLVNVPLGSGSLLRSLASVPLPGGAAEIGCTGWSPLLLKYVLANPAVTCVIPGTGQGAHMRDNAQAGSGPLPDAALCRRIEAVVDAL